MSPLDGETAKLSATERALGVWLTCYALVLAEHALMSKGLKKRSRNKRRLIKGTLNTLKTARITTNKLHNGPSLFCLFLKVRGKKDHSCIANIN